MEAKELMIGDWVRNDLGETQQVVELREEGVMLYYNDIYPYDDVQPIPLTPEILEKNGFENDFYEEESVADYHTIRLEGYSLKHNVGEIDGYLVTWCNGGINVTTDFNGCVQKDISYVHELKHCLKMVGINKEIIL